MTDVEKLVLGKVHATSEAQSYEDYLAILREDLLDSKVSEMEYRADMPHDEVFDVREQIERL